MLISALVLFSSAMLSRPPAPIFADVYVGANGPYRFLVDTGAQTSLIDPKLAAELGLAPSFRVQVLTQLTTRSLPATKLRGLRIGATALPETELVFHEVEAASRMGKPVRGLLGINALQGLNFALTPASGRLEIGGPRPEGVATPIYSVENRLALRAQMGGESLLLALDSGAHHVILFHTPAAMAKTSAVPATLTTLEGARTVVPTTWTAVMMFADRLRIETLPAAIVPRAESEVDGLLPASVFKTIYVDQERGEAILAR